MLRRRLHTNVKPASKIRLYHRAGVAAAGERAHPLLLGERLGIMAQGL